MIVERSYRFRFYPTAEQAQMLVRWFGASRWVWNHALERRSKAYRRRKASVSGVDVSRALTQLKRTTRHGWLREVPSTVITQKLRDQDRAFANFFSGRAKYPRFRSRRQYAQAIRLQLDQRQVYRLYDAEVGYLRLPKLGTLKLRWSRAPKGTPKMVTVRRDAAGRWWVSFMVREAVEPLPVAGKAVGIDRGLTDLAVCSDGQRIANPKHLARYRDRLRRAQRHLSRRRKGSGRWHAQRLRVARLHARVRNARSDWLHKATTRLVRENQVLAVESLNVKGMLGNGKLAQAIGDAAWHEAHRQLAYKAQWCGRTLLAVDQWYPSSKTCSACGYVLEELGLEVRTWTCPQCGVYHDRDINAARNLLDEGMKQLLPRGAGEVTRVERGSCSRPGTTRPAVPLDETRTAQPTNGCMEQPGDG